MFSDIVGCVFVQLGKMVHIVGLDRDEFSLVRLLIAVVVFKSGGGGGVKRISHGAQATFHAYPWRQKTNKQTNKQWI